MGGGLKSGLRCKRCGRVGAGERSGLCERCVVALEAEVVRLRRQLVIVGEFLARQKYLLDKHYAVVTEQIEALAEAC